MATVRVVPSGSICLCVCLIASCPPLRCVFRSSSLCSPCSRLRGRCAPLSILGKQDCFVEAVVSTRRPPVQWCTAVEPNLEHASVGADQREGERWELSNGAPRKGPQNQNAETRTTALCNSAGTGQRATTELQRQFAMQSEHARLIREKADARSAPPTRSDASTICFHWFAPQQSLSRPRFCDSRGGDASSTVTPIEP